MSGRVECIDSHVHAFPEMAISGKDALLSHDAWFASCYEKRTLASCPDVGALCDRDELTYALCCSWAFRDPDICLGASLALGDEVKGSGDPRIKFLGTPHPKSPTLEADVAKLVEAGAIGIGEINPDAQRAEDGELADLARLCGEAGLPLLLHASEPVGHRYPGKGGYTPGRIGLLLEAAPSCTVILAHLGGGLPFYALMPELAAMMEHAYVDCAAGPWLYKSESLDAAVALLGPGKLIYGSDAPLLTRTDYERWGAFTDPADPAMFAATARKVYRL